MPVGNDTVLKKIMHELQQATNKQHKQEEMLKHIANIKLLCDLFLMEEGTESPDNREEEISAVELKAMLGERQTQAPSQQPTFKKSIELDDEDGNGDSLFDF
ncbi:YwdI family protein [Ornithinibacillus scapharcae]|uniref:YwdI family protein n=1 Tax=Ornithinibacillus scapharcae TaxID=1147159 RepID=UPI000225BCD9|nr:YwdI family protein [Ornithinibacillus scapharcae]